MLKVRDSLEAEAASERVQETRVEAVDAEDSLCLLEALEMQHCVVAQAEIVSKQNDCVPRLHGYYWLDCDMKLCFQISANNEPPGMCLECTSMLGL